MIQTRGLTKRYGGIVAVDDLSFDVLPGKVTALLGPNGAGKSTALRLMLDLERGGGETLYDGRRYRRLRRPGAEVGACVGATGAHPGRRVRAHLRMLAAAGGIPNRRVNEVLDLVGLTPVAGARVRVLSAGALGRLGLAGALLGDPGTLVLDEPATGLDPQGVRWLRDFLRAFAADGRTVLVAGHILAETANCADRVLVISRGRLVADESALDFLRRGVRAGVSVRTPQVARLSALLRAEGVHAARSGGTTLVVTGADRARVGEIAFRGGILLHELAEREPGVGDAFTDVITVRRERPQVAMDEDAPDEGSAGLGSTNRPTEELVGFGAEFTTEFATGFTAESSTGPDPATAPAAAPAGATSATVLGTGHDRAPGPDPHAESEQPAARPRAQTPQPVEPGSAPATRDTASIAAPEPHRIVETHADPAAGRETPRAAHPAAEAGADTTAARNPNPNPNATPAALPPRRRFARTWRSTERTRQTDEVRSA
ncbi:ATP-binding cassette domain-containing protein [Embleya sp. NPDC020886]|uniref:ATP-binding cassette domain-containing protein n=1 Tax=Embleya sp. NPDC020886 TaxID=3363980 RepID=UPI00379C6882